jgi:hypothetical protein
MPRKKRSDQEDVARLAYLLWERAGWPEGQSLKFWIEAERRLKGRAGGRPLKLRHENPFNSSAVRGH